MFEISNTSKVLPNISEIEIKALNTKYKPLSATERIKQLLIQAGQRIYRPPLS